MPMHVCVGGSEAELSFLLHLLPSFVLRQGLFLNSELVGVTSQPASSGMTGRPPCHAHLASGDLNSSPATCAEALIHLPRLTFYSLITQIFVKYSSLSPE